MRNATDYPRELENYSIQVVDRSIFLLTVNKYIPGHLHCLKSILLRYIDRHEDSGFTCGFLVNIRDVERTQMVLSYEDCYAIADACRCLKMTPKAIGFIARDNSLTYQIARELIFSTSEGSIYVWRFDTLDDAVSMIRTCYERLKYSPMSLL